MKCMLSHVSVGLLVLTSIVGCGKSGETPTASVPGPGAAGAVTPEAPAGAKPVTGPQPDAVVTSFLESLRNGNDALAASLLTQKAREETLKEGLKVQPPGTPDMKYEIGETEYVSEAKDGAHVGSVWTLAIENGQTESFDVIWVLRLENQGWRIAGMATPGEANQPPTFFNFEDPEVLKSWKNEGTEMVENEATTPETNPPTMLQPRDSGVQNAEVGAGGNPLR